MLLVASLPPDIFKQCLRQVPVSPEHNNSDKRWPLERFQIDDVTDPESVELFTNMTWAEWLAFMAYCMGVQPLVSVNAHQRPEYEKYFKQEVLVTDTPMGQGPLRGLLSAYQDYPDHDFLALSCDMPLIHPKLMDILIHHYCNFIPAYKSIGINSREIGVLPFPGVYSWETMRYAEMEKENLSHSCKKLLDNTKTLKINLKTDEWYPFLNNFNNSEDLLNLN